MRINFCSKIIGLDNLTAEFTYHGIEIYFPVPNRDRVLCLSRVIPLDDWPALEEEIHAAIPNPEEFFKHPPAPPPDDFP